MTLPLYLDFMIKKRNCQFNMLDLSKRVQTKLEVEDEDSTPNRTNSTMVELNFRLKLIYIYIYILTQLWLNTCLIMVEHMVEIQCGMLELELHLLRESFE